MNTKLTLTIEKEIIEIAKKYAKDKGQNLSEIVENYFKLITVNRREIKPEKLSPRIRRLRGIIKTNKQLNHKQIISEELSDRLHPSVALTQEARATGIHFQFTYYLCNCGKR